MSTKKFFLALSVLCVATSTCRSQPVEGEGKAQNPTAADAQKAAIDKAMAEGRAAMQKILVMTPAQRREYVDQIAETQLRTLMTANGLDDLEVQEQVIVYTREQGVARAKVREAGARLRDALADKASTKEAMASLLNEYRAASEAERTRRDQAESKLREDLELSQNPRLDGVLQLYGVIGDASWFTGGMLSGMGAIATLPMPGELPKRPEPAK